MQACTKHLAGLNALCKTHSGSSVSLAVSQHSAVVRLSDAASQHGPSHVLNEMPRVG